jgi:hypothetical protein
MPASVSVLMASGATRGDAPAEVAVCRSLPLHRRAVLAHLRVEDHPDRLASFRIASAARGRG